MRECFISDIDGTLADCAHRRHLLEVAPGGKKNWDKFFALAPKDPVIRPVAETIKALARSYPVLYVSARRQTEKDATIKWLRQHGLWIYPFKLYIREDGDRRDDQVFKREVLHQIRLEGWNPLGVFDDRKRVVDMWREEGLLCFHVAEGNF